MTDTRSTLSRPDLRWLMEQMEEVDQREPDDDEDPVKRAQAQRLDQYELERASGEGMSEPLAAVTDPGARGPDDEEL